MGYAARARGMERSASFHTHMSPKQLVGRAAAEHFWGEFRDRLEGEDIDGAVPLVLGLGSGSTVAAFWQELARLLQDRRSKPARRIVVVPTSMQSRDLILSSGLATCVLGDIEQFSHIDFLVDGFDRIDKQGNMIKGGGAAHVLEKLVALHAARSLYVGTADKLCPALGHAQQESIPVEVLACASAYVERSLRSLGGTCVRRASNGGKMGPVISDNGNVILDWTLPAASPLWDNPRLLDQTICSLTGVLGSSLFVGLCSKALVMGENGNMSIINA